MNLDEALFDACKQTILEKHHIEQFLREGADPNKRGFHGIVHGTLSAFMALIARPYPEQSLLKLFIEHGASIEEVSANRMLTPLILASTYNHFHVVATLLQKGADVNKLVQGEDGCALTASITSNRDLRKVTELLLEKGADPNQFSETGMSPLLKAIKEDRMDLAELLIQYGADPNKKLMPNQTSSVESSAQFVESLLQNKGQLGSLSHLSGADFGFHTPLTMAIHEKRSLEFIELLVQANADINSFTSRKYPALAIALRQNNRQIASLLIQRGANLNRREAVVSPFLYFVKSRNPDIKLLDLLIRAGADINETDGEGNTALMFSVLSSNMELIQALLKHKPNKQAKNTFNKTALKLAKEMKNQHVVALLNEHMVRSMDRTRIFEIFFNQIKGKNIYRDHKVEIKMGISGFLVLFLELKKEFCYLEHQEVEALEIEEYLLRLILKNNRNTKVLLTFLNKAMRGFGLTPYTPEELQQIIAQHYSDIQQTATLEVNKIVPARLMASYLKKGHQVYAGDRESYHTYSFENDIFIYSGYDRLMSGNHPVAYHEMHEEAFLRDIAFTFSFCEGFLRGPKEWMSHLTEALTLEKCKTLREFSSKEGTQPEASDQKVKKSGDPGLDADKDPVRIAHQGQWKFHDDDCWCLANKKNRYCNRNGYTWSCCGSGKKLSDCAAPHMHPTYHEHAKFEKTVVDYNQSRQPEFRSNKDIQKIAPECFSTTISPGS